MQCPKCKSNLYGKVPKCLVCGYEILNNSKKEENQINNGILNPRDFADYTKKLELNKRKNKETNIIIPIMFILIVIIILIILTLIKFIKA